MKCIICKKETNGSVGTAGIHWSNICQSCKDQEDQALLKTIKSQQFILNEITKIIWDIAQK